MLLIINMMLLRFLRVSPLNGEEEEEEEEPVLAGEEGPLAEVSSKRSKVEAWLGRFLSFLLTYYKNDE